MNKTLLILSAFLLGSTAVWAQIPGSFSYQSVIRDASNNLVSNQSVATQLSILQGSISGTAVYVETHAVTTNDNGLATLEIGTGTVSLGTSVSDINWANGPYFLKSETDPTGGSNYTISATSQLLSVPYAMLASNVALTDGQGGVYELSVDTLGNLWSVPVVYNPNNPPLIELKEVYYDYPSGGDDNYEWVKIYNPNHYPVDLSEYRIANGGTSFQEVMQLSGTIPANTCWVVGGPFSDANNGNPVYDISDVFSSLLQNSGATADGVAIYYGAVTNPGNNPISVVIYGDVNTNNLPGTDGNSASVDVGDVSGGSSIFFNPLTNNWEENTTPTPNVCP